VSGNEAIVVDPSVSVSAIEKLLDEHSAKLVGILLTHGHFDHTISVDTLRSKYPIPLMMHSGDSPMLTDGKINGFYDFYKQESIHAPAEKILADGEKLKIGDEYALIISTPGHSPGSICILCENDAGKSFMITGDTLFADSIGRCDLWGGNESTIRESLRRLSTYDHTIRIYAGHGLSSTLGSALENAKYYIDF
jgi:glyoxylase-like metal-dependent hydrolase (beta-lactamase superfamily II)